MAKKTNKFKVTIDIPGTNFDHGMGISAAQRLRCRSNRGTDSGTASFIKKTKEISYTGTMPPEAVQAELISYGLKIVSTSEEAEVSRQNQALLGKLESYVSETAELIAAVAQSTALNSELEEKLHITLAQVAELREQKKVDGFVIPAGSSFDQALLKMYVEIEAEKTLRLGETYDAIKSAAFNEITPYRDTPDGVRMLENIKNLLDGIGMKSPLYAPSKRQNEALFASMEDAYQSMMEEKRAEAQETLAQNLSGQHIKLLYAEKNGLVRITLPVFVDEDMRNGLGNDIVEYVREALDKHEQTGRIAYVETEHDDLVAFTVQYDKHGLVYQLERDVNNGAQHPIRKSGLTFRIGPVGVPVEKEGSLEKVVQDTAQTLQTPSVPIVDVRRMYDLSSEPRIREGTRMVYQTIVDVIADTDGLSSRELNKAVQERLGEEKDLRNAYTFLQSKGFIEPIAGRGHGYKIGPNLKKD